MTCREVIPIHPITPMPHAGNPRLVRAILKNAPVCASFKLPAKACRHGLEGLSIMGVDQIKASLNLGAVLQNLAELCRLDPESQKLIRDWDVCVQFTVFAGPKAWVEFRGGECRTGLGTTALSDVHLVFVTPGHLNAMFAGSAIPPIPVKGFKRLGFLKNEFPRITARLEHYLKPGPGMLDDPAFLAANTTLTLHTAANALRELVKTEPTAGKIAAGTPTGRLQLAVGSDGPAAWVSFSPNGMEVGRGRLEHPDATMTFRDIPVAQGVLSGKEDGLAAIGRGEVVIWGMLPLIDSATLIMDRVERYLA